MVLGRLKSLASHDDTLNSGSSGIYGTHVVHRVADRVRGLSGRSKMDQELSHIAEHIAIGLRTPGDGKIEVGPDIFFEHCQYAEDEAFRTQVLGISKSSWLASMSQLEGGITKDSGKSGSLFWKTHDGRYFLKSAPKVEAETLLEIMPSYRQYVQEAKAASRLCLLPQMLGIYCIYAGEEELYLQAFSNVFDTAAVPERIYDLKGTTEDRYVSEAPGKVMKDLNYADTSISISGKDRQALLDACAADAEFLESHNIMDYSLLLGVYPMLQAKQGIEEVGAASFQGSELTENPEDGNLIASPSVFRLGIIDIACAYTMKKVAAHWLKKPTLGWCCRQEIDTEPPGYYSDRFVNFVDEKFVDEEIEDLN